MSLSLISDITSVSGGSALRGAPNRVSGVRHAAFEGQSISDGGEGISVV